MLSANPNKIIIIRNYLILMGLITIVIAGLSNVFDNPDRVGQKDRIENFGRYITAGFINQAQKIGR
ncbi:MAG: hypothetical protein AAGF26_02605 [Cyanobacteria bacterium P01_G01_bin.49]